MAGVADGWAIGELHRGFGQLFIKLASPAVDAVMAIDFATGNPDSTANPSGISVGYTNEGWEFATSPTFDEIRVDEEEDAISDFITANEATISGAMRQVRNLSKLQTLLPGSVRTAPTGTPTQIEKVTGGGLQTFDYFCAALVWPDDDDADVVWWVMLYRCLNRGGLTIGIGRTKDSAATVTLTGRAVSGRTAGDRTYAIVRAEDLS
jgi:hypothetical protein